MITRFEATKLNGNVSCKLAFDPTINILTGPNGSGKTTVLKILWYLVSGNIERLGRELESFERVHVDTTRFSLTIHRIAASEAAQANTPRYDIAVRIGDDHSRIHASLEEITNETPAIRNVNRNTGNKESTIFFPTFRRIEGGFGISEDTRPPAASIDADVQRSIQRAFTELTRLRTLVGRHKFVTSTATRDIVDLLTATYADISQKSNYIHQQLTQYILSVVSRYRDITYSAKVNKDTQLDHAIHALDDISRRSESVDGERADLLKPITTLSDLVAQLYGNRGIRMTQSLILGKQEPSIDSSHLSSGEKQMLSFLCYNALYRDTTFFIDEPELSLHIDWQRMLFPILLSQPSNNQFIVATHSPSIYANYQDKQLALPPLEN